MKKITAMLIALTIAALSLTGCSNDEGTSSVTEQNVSGLTSENETFVTTSTTEEVTEESTEEDNSLITADTREELAKGLLEALLTEDKDTVIRYGVSNKNYTSMREAISKGKDNAGLSDTDEVTISDFEIYITGPFKGSVCEALNSEYDKAFVYIISPTLTTVSLHFQIIYDYDMEQYVIDSAFVDGTHYDKLLPRLANEQPIQ